MRSSSSTNPTNCSVIEYSSPEGGSQTLALHIETTKQGGEITFVGWVWFCWTELTTWEWFSLRLDQYPLHLDNWMLVLRIQADFKNHCYSLTRIQWNLKSQKATFLSSLYSFTAGLLIVSIQVFGKCKCTIPCLLMMMSLVAIIIRWQLMHLWQVHTWWLVTDVNLAQIRGLFLVTEYKTG